MSERKVKKSAVSAWIDRLSNFSSVGTPTITQIVLEGQRAVRAGIAKDGKQFENLIYLLHNSFVSLDTKFAEDVRFAYGGIGVVIHKSADIGRDVMIGQGVTLGGGGKSRIDKQGKRSYVPKINDHVYIAAGARILGGVEVGCLSIIGTNAVVAQNVPPLSIVTGVPGVVSNSITVQNCLRYKNYFSFAKKIVNSDFVKLIQAITAHLNKFGRIDSVEPFMREAKMHIEVVAESRTTNALKSDRLSLLYRERLDELNNPSLVEHGRELIVNQRWSASGYYQPVKLAIPVDWEMDPFSDRTWKWFLHQFEFISSLLAYDMAKSGDQGYELAKQFVRSWANLYLHDMSNTDSVWHDHGTALRARNLLLLLAYLKASEKDDRFDVELTRILVVHAKVLLEESFYSRGTNHGLDQNIVLFELLKELGVRSDIHVGAINTACERVNYEIAKAFADDGGHIENSAAYLTFGLKQAVDALHIGKAYDQQDSMIQLPNGLLEKVTTALTHMTKPDGKLPLIGDTCDYVVRDIFKDIKPKNYQEFVYATSKGVKGRKPAVDSLVLKDSGWAVFRSNWSVAKGGDFQKQLHFVFKCGFLSNYHRHDDDLSFVLFNKGRDWIIEGGLYKHSRTDPYRVYFRSAEAHNISMPYRERASRMLETASGTGIVSYDLAENSSVVDAVSNMFVGFDSRRSVSYSRADNSLTLKDRIYPKSEDKQQKVDGRIEQDLFTYVTRFIVPEDKTIKFDRRRKVCLIQDVGGDVLIIQISGPAPSFRVVTGQTEPEVKGWISNRPNKLKPCQVIEFLYKEKTLDVDYSLSWR